MPTHPSFTFRKQFNLQHLGGWMEALSEPMTLKFEHCRHFFDNASTHQIPSSYIQSFGSYRAHNQTQKQTNEQEDSVDNIHFIVLCNASGEL